LLLREQQHRVRNSLMAITAMLRSGERGAAGAAEDARARFAEVRRRVSALASHYDHLLDAGPSADGTACCLRGCLAALCASACDFHGLAARGIALAFEAGGDGALPMGIDICTALGVVVNELVANAVEHGLGPAGAGPHRGCVGPGRGRQRGRFVEDDGVGVPPGAES
jgi:two-component sensor histidine kinase